MNKELTNTELQAAIRRDKRLTKYLQIDGIGRNNIKGLSREDQKVVDSFVSSKKVTIWIRKQ